VDSTGSTGGYSGQYWGCRHVLWAVLGLQKGTVDSSEAVGTMNSGTLWQGYGNSAL
jgi:hypothetical protein